jgi:hypothetical protein
MSSCFSAVRFSSPVMASILFFPSHRDFIAVQVSRPSITCVKKGEHSAVAQHVLSTCKAEIAVTLCATHNVEF